MILVLSGVLLLSAYTMPLARTEYSVERASFPPDLPGDITLDGKVNIYDLVSVALRIREDPTYWDPIADVNEDGKINVGDLVSVAKRIGNTYDTSPIPIAYSTSFEFQVPSDGDNVVWYYLLIRIYLPSEFAGKEFYLYPEAVDDYIRNVKIDCQQKYGGGHPACQPPTSINLGILGMGYHLLELEFGEQWSGGKLQFNIATTLGEKAWMDRFRIYVPDYNVKSEYIVRTTTNFTNYDLYYLKGYADDYICNFKVNSIQWYEWQWSGKQETIYAWKDGLLYPVFNSKESGVFHVEFTFGNINSTGLLDFQFLSWEHDRVKIGKPRFWTQTKIKPLGPAPYSSKELYDYSALISAGSEWCSVNGISTGNPTDFAFVNQGVELLMNLSDCSGSPIIQKLKLDTLIGWIVMDPRQNDYVDVGIIFNLTGGDLYYSFFEGNQSAPPDDPRDWDVWAQITSLEIWTPDSVASPVKIVFANETPTTSFVGPDWSIVGSFAGDVTSGLLWWEFSTTEGILAGPWGIVAATAAGTVIKLSFNFLNGQKVIETQKVTSNSTYLCAKMSKELWVHTETYQSGKNEAESGTQAVFVRLKGINRYHCGAIKIKIKFTVAAHEIIILSGQVVYDEYRMEIEQTFLIPIFIRD